MRKTGRLAAILLSLLLLLSALPMTVSARQHYNLYIIYPDIQAKQGAGSSPYGDNTTDFYRQRLPFDGNYQCVYLAQNEAEGFQLFFYEWYDPRELHVTVSDFVNASGEKLPHTVYVEEYFKATGVDAEDTLADPLLPYRGEGVMTRPQDNRMFYVELKSAKDQTPGEYTATVTLSDEQGVLETRYIKATVWSFALPEAHYATTITGLYDNASGYGQTQNFLKASGVRVSGNEVVAEDVPLAESILEGWQEVLLEHGVTTYELPRFLIDSDAKAAQLAMADTRRKAFSIPLLSKKLSGGCFDAETTAKIEQYKDLIEGNAYLEDKAFFYPDDEPNWFTSADTAYFDSLISAVNARWPNAHIVTPLTMPKPEQPYDYALTLDKLRESTDILCFNQGLLYQNLNGTARTDFTDGSWYRTWRFQGDVQDGGFYFNRWGKATTGLFRRILYWQASALGSDGILHWNAAFLPDDTDGEPYDVWAHKAIPPGIYPSTGNGDGILVYPGYSIGQSQTKPVLTLRLKQIRDGMDDYDYLTMAKEFLGEEQWADFIDQVLIKYADSGIEKIYHSERTRIREDGKVVWDGDWIPWECVTMNNARVAIGNALSEANTTHNYGAWQTVVEPDENHDGLEVRACADCGAEESRAMTTHAHTFGEWTQTTAPTCTVEGQETRGCTGCGVTETREIPAAGHTFGAYTGDDATCTAGSEKTRTCSVCGMTETLSRQALGHDWGDWTETAATCTEDGVKTHACVRCGVTETETLSAATGHDFGDWTVTTEPTCTEAGEQTRTCAVCGETQNEAIPAAGHDYGEWITTTEPTCTEAGEQTRTCSVCGDTESQPVDALGHDLTTTADEPTCTAPGYRTTTCSRCDYFDVEEIPALGHAFDAEVTPPTCTQIGYTTYTCARCGETYTDDETAALGHHWVTKTVMHAQLVVCERCGILREDWIPIQHIDPRLADFMDKHLTHDVNEWIQLQPSCVNPGLITYTCADCGEEITVEDPALGHNLGDWVVTKEPTATEEGEETRACSRCDYTETRTLDMISDPAILVSSAKARPGDTVQITVSIQNNPGIIATMLHLSYDSEVLTLTAVDNGTVFGDEYFQAGGDLSALPFNVHWYDALGENRTADGTLVTFTFTVAGDAPDGMTTVAVVCDARSTFNRDLEAVSFDVQNGTIDIRSRVPGDANGDGTVDLKDTTSIARYLAGGWGVTIDEDAANIDGDNMVTLRDVVILRRFLAGWAVVLQ